MIKIVYDENKRKRHLGEYQREGVIIRIFTHAIRRWCERCKKLGIDVVYEEIVFYVKYHELKHYFQDMRGTLYTAVNPVGCNKGKTKQEREAHLFGVERCKEHFKHEPKLGWRVK